jgi:hypothetical protein
MNMVKSKQKSQKQPIRYWLVEITLTSGEGLHFYVKAPTQIEADEKAEGYCELVSNDVLRNKLMKFQLMT